MVDGTAQSLGFLTPFAREGEPGLTRQKHLPCAVESVSPSRKHGTQEDPQAKAEGHAGQDTLEIRGLVRREQLEESIGDEGHAQQSPQPNHSAVRRFFA